MSGVQSHVLGHLVRRGYEVVQAHVQGISAETMTALEHDAELYENAGPDMEVHGYELLPVFITAVLALVVIASIRYTIGEVMASLAMIESPTTTAIIEDKPPAYADEPDAPLEKEPLMPSEAEADRAEPDVEVSLIRNKPVTARITTTIGHLQRVGGFRARWRGLGLSVIYHGLHSYLASTIAHGFGFGLIGQAFVYMLTSVCLARLHMAWTHSMIAFPSSKPFWRRMVPAKQCNAVLLPSLAFAAAQQATLLFPIFFAGIAVGGMGPDDVLIVAQGGPSDKLARAVPVMLVAALATALLLLLPAAATLTRIEAALLPEGEETIVPFDRATILGDIDLTARGSSKALFVQAWRSFDSAAKSRLVKLYLKMVLIQATVGFIALHLMVAELYIFGGKRLVIFVKSAAAQLQLMAIEARQTAN